MYYPEKGTLRGREFREHYKHMIKMLLLSRNHTYDLLRQVCCHVGLTLERDNDATEKNGYITYRLSDTK